MKPKIFIGGLVVALLVGINLSVHFSKKDCPGRSVLPPSDFPAMERRVSFKEAEAIPAWGRRYDASCTMCHTMYPQLNSYGHKFRRQGNRTPDEFENHETKIPVEELRKLSHYFSARGRARALYTNSKEDPDNFEFQMHDVTLFYAGPVTRNIGFFFELPFEPDEGHAFLEVGQMNLTFGNPDLFFFTRFGQFHQFSRVGFGGLDRPIGLTNARVFEDRVNGFRPRHDGIGVEAGFSYKDFTGLLQVTNGIEATGGSVLDNTDPNNHKDIAALLEYVVPDTDASVSFLYVYGKSPTPQDNAGAVVAGAKQTQYHRLYLFGDYTFDKIGLRPLVGGGLGFDNQFVSGIGTAGAALISPSSSRSWFTFLELNQKILESLYAFARFDYFDVTNKAESTVGTRKTWYGTTGLVFNFQDHLRLAGEYQARDNKSQKLDHQLLAEAQFNF